MAQQVFYKLDIQGIVYLVDPLTTAAYTYDLTNPVRIGQVVWTDPSAPPQLIFSSNWEEILRDKLATANPEPSITQ